MEPAARLEPRTAAALGAVAAAFGVVVVMPFFFPLGRLFDPTFGGALPVDLVTELSIGLYVGLVLSPLAAGIGALVGWRLAGRPIGPPLAVVLIVVAALLALGFLGLVSGGEFNDSGARNSVQFAMFHGALAGTVAVLVYRLALRRVLARRQLVPQGASQIHRPT